MKMIDYSKMSDFEINKRIAHALGNAQVCHADDEINGAKVQYFVYKSSGLNREGLISMRPHIIKKDFCNNPADAWPIIDDNNITIINDNPSLRFAVSEVAAYFNGSNHIWSAHGNGLRAAMIVFLKMQGEKK